MTGCSCCVGVRLQLGGLPSVGGRDLANFLPPCLERWSALLMQPQERDFAEHLLQNKPQ